MGPFRPRSAARLRYNTVMSEADPYAALYPFNQPPAPLIALAGSLRDLIETSARVATLSPEVAAEVEAARLQIDALRRNLEPFAHHDATPRMGAEPAGQRPYFVAGVIMGPHHPLRPDLEIEHADGVTRGRVRFGVSFEGPPGGVHGGYVAHFFDQILGQHNLFAKIPAMTGNLSVRYREATPILQDLAFEVTHRPDGDRKVLTRSALRANDRTYAEGEGLFIVPKGSGWRID